MTSIEWTRGDDGAEGKTWNPVVGCSRVSEGCRHCYAERQAFRNAAMGSERYAGLTKRVGGEIRWTGTVRLVPEALELPLRWRKPRRIFVNSMSDLFHEALSDEAIDQVFAVMALAERHTFQVLTKRPGRMLRYLSGAGSEGDAVAEAVYLRQWAPDVRDDVDVRDATRLEHWPLPNVWLGVSVEDQASADARIPLLLQTPAVVRWISLEPQLEPVNLARYLVGHEEHGIALDRPAGARVGATVGWTPALDWVVQGGESGAGARSFDLDWARLTRDQCHAAGVAFFYKQGGSSNRCMHSAKGGHLECFPPNLRVREYPEARADLHAQGRDE